MEKRISEIKEEFANASPEELHSLYARYADDTRTGVVNLITKYRKQEAKLQEEIARTEAMSRFEREYESYGYICGIDEVGRGPLAGPVVAGAVILPKDEQILYLNDSKKLSEKKREELYDVIMEKAIATGIGIVSPARIDEINILQATYEAMRIAISNLPVKPDVLLNDAVTIPEVAIPQVPIIKGDAKSVSIAAASIIAKVTRDRLMVEYDKVLPGYGFAGNKGYGSAAHIAALRELGPTPIQKFHINSAVLQWIRGCAHAAVWIPIGEGIWIIEKQEVLMRRLQGSIWHCMDMKSWNTISDAGAAK